jgi:hypothetical protein
MYEGERHCSPCLKQCHFDFFFIFYWSMKQCYFA